MSPNREEEDDGDDEAEWWAGDENRLAGRLSPPSDGRFPAIGRGFTGQQGHSPENPALSLTILNASFPIRIAYTFILFIYYSFIYSYYLFI